MTKRRLWQLAMMASRSSSLWHPARYHLFGLTLLGVTAFYQHTPHVAVAGLVTISGRDARLRPGDS